MTPLPSRRARRTTLGKARDDLTHLAAHFAVLHRGGAALVNTHPEGAGRAGWVLLVKTVEGTLAWPIRDQDLDLFDRVTRIDPGDPRTADMVAALARTNERLEALTESAWVGAGFFFGRDLGASE